jgi:hypothetical protein
MKKRESIKNALTAAIVFLAAKMLLDTAFILCDPLVDLSKKLYHMSDDNIHLSVQTKIILMLAMLIAFVPKLVLAVFNRCKPDLVKHRGTITVILTAAFGLISSVVSVLSKNIAYRIGDSTQIFIISSLNNIRAYTGLLSGAATIILYCCGAIEIYNGTEKNVYPPVNGDFNNTEDTLS